MQPKKRVHQPVVVVGAANIDLYGFSSDPLVFRDSNPGEVRQAVGGVGRNIAENLSRLAVPTELITAVDDGPGGAFMLENCAAVGMGTAHTLVVPGGRVSTYIAILDRDGDMALALSDMRIVDELTPQVLQERRGVLETAAVIAADTNIPVESLAFLLEGFPEVPVCVDPVSAAKGRKLLPLAGNIHTLKMNRLEAEALSGVRIRSDEDFWRAADFFLRLGTKRVFITRGQEGVCWHTTDSEGSFRPPPVQAVNVSGAGDAFMAGLICALLNGWDDEESARFASAAASLTLERTETVNPALTLERVWKRMG